MWTFQIETTNKNNQADGRAQEALINKIQRPGVFINFTPIEDGYTLRPRLWKSGDQLSGVQVDGTQTTGYNIKLKGLPSGYTLSRGDFLSFPFGGVHRLFMVTDDVTATETTATVPINLPLYEGSLPANNTTVSLINPQVTCQYVDGSYSGMTFSPKNTSSISFAIQQVFRV